jgi:hypothetical protein
MSRGAEQLSHQSSGFRSFSIGFGVGAIVMLMLAVILGGLLIDRSKFAPAQETTGSGDSTRTAREPEIDSTTGAPLTHLGPGDLVTGSEALKHPAPMRKATSRQP